MAQYACDVCGAKLKSPQAVGAHYRYKHPGTKTTREKAVEKTVSKNDVAEIAVDVMLKHLFPEGIPAKKIPAMLKWVEATKELAK